MLGPDEVIAVLLGAAQPDDLVGVHPDRRGLQLHLHVLEGLQLLPELLGDVKAARRPGPVQKKTGRGEKSIHQ